MAPQQFADVFNKNMLASWHNVSKIRTPIIAAVNGYRGAEHD